MILCVNGRFVPSNKAKISALDNGFLYGDGFYDTMRTYNGVLLELEEHLSRIEHSATRMQIALPWSRHLLRSWILILIKKNRLKEARVRVTITRGTHGFDFIASRDPTLIISAEKLQIPSTVYSKGVVAITMKLERLMPDIKTIGLTNMIVAYQASSELDAYEVICHTSTGRVLEGASTNVFLVSRGSLITPKKGILPGMTRKCILMIARSMKLNVKVQDFSFRRLYSADEIFLTNRPREIIPVIQVNNRVIGNGRPGNITRRLMMAYQEYVEKYTAKHRLGQKEECNEEKN